ncbi:hypothetical protein Gotur_032970 [Gossypium turneri]
MRDLRKLWTANTNKGERFISDFAVDSASTISNSTLIWRIQHLLSHEDQWLVRHISREYNHVADALAKLAFGQKEDMQILDFPTREIKEILETNRVKNVLFQNVSM